MRHSPSLVDQFRIFTREDVHILNTLSSRTLLDVTTGSPVAVYTHEAELFSGRRKVIVKQFEAHSDHVARNVSNHDLVAVFVRLT